MAAGDEDASGDECFLGLALESTRVADHLVEMLGRIGDHLCYADCITVGTDLSVGGHKSLIGLGVGGFTLSSGELAALDAVAERDGCLQVRTIQKSIWGLPNTRRIIIALIVIRKGTPFRASVDDPLPEH